ncbi:MAG: 4Fe-4S binding protein [Candidatus Bathyarchaeia archaeon]
MAILERVAIDSELCKGCGICIEFCPTKALALGDSLNSKGVRPAVLRDPSACRLCGLCELYCPDFAIAVAKVQMA